MSGSPEYNLESGKYANIAKDIIRMYKVGKTYETMAKHLGISLASVNNLCRFLRRKGILGNKHVEEQTSPSIQPLMDLTKDEEIVRRLCAGKPRTVGELSRKIDRSKETVIKLIDSLRIKNFEIRLDEERRQVILDREPRIIKDAISIEPLYRNRLKIGVISDTHLCSVKQQLTILNTFYEIGEKEKVDLFCHSGDMTEGSGKHYLGQMNELFIWGADKQKEYVIKHYPKTDKFKTYIISGGHDEDYLKTFGHNIIKAICKERKDIIYRGDSYGTLDYKGLQIEMIHPRGGAAYARSYKAQKRAEGDIATAINELLFKKKSRLPKIQLVGHYHITNYLPYTPIHSFLVPCCQAQTIYLKQLGLSPIIGMWIITVSYDKQGIYKVIPDFRDFTYMVKENDY